jgi:CRISPR-associated endonuclease/helicase Cas3
MNYYAHTAELADGTRDPDTRHWQLLCDHLRKVAKLAKQFAAPLGLAEEAELAGLLHDLGKYRDEFQAYLRGERGSSVETQHAIYGAAWAMERSLAATLPVAGHHAGLHDCGDLPGMLVKPTLRITQTVPELIARLETELGPLPPLPTLPAWVKNEISAEFYTRLIFSSLIDADRLDTACWPDSPPPDRDLQVEQLLTQVHAERSRKAKAAKNPDSPLAMLRNHIFDTAIERAMLPSGFFSLSAHSAFLTG